MTVPQTPFLTCLTQALSVQCPITYAMDGARLAVTVGVVVILGVTLASGPLVGAVDLTRESADESVSGTGNATVTVTSLPDRVSLDRGEYGSEAYYLEVPDAFVRLERVEGEPMVVYKVRIPDLGFVRGTTYFVDSDNEGEMALAVERTAIDPASVTRDSYQGQLEVIVRSGTAGRVLRTHNVTVEVSE